MRRMRLGTYGVLTWTTGTKTAMDDVEGNRELLLLWKTEAERGRGRSRRI
jgi:hypothetical protein